MISSITVILKRTFFPLLVFVLFGCNGKEAKSSPELSFEYYPNGNVKSKVSYENEKRVVTHFFEDMPDSVETVIKQINDTVTWVKYYWPKNKLKETGYFYLDSLKIGKWKIYDANGKLNDVREYILLDKNSYLNQRWVLNAKGDTIGGNYYKLKMSDTVGFNEANRFYFLLKQPLFSERSEAFIILPKNEQKLRKDFSNHKSIKWDTIYSIGTKYKMNEELKFRNHDIILDAFSAEKGEMSLKGILVEKELYEADSIDFKTRNIYFDIPYFVK